MISEQFYSFFPQLSNLIYIQKILYLDATFVALKAVMIVLKWYRIQDLPIHWSYRIKRDEIALVTDYNINDVLGTDALVKNQQKELDLRAKLSEMYAIDLRNMSRSSIGKNLMTNSILNGQVCLLMSLLILELNAVLCLLVRLLKIVLHSKLLFIGKYLKLFKDIVFILV